jgi:hypothetical protein
MTARVARTEPRLEMIFVRLSSLSITYILTPAPSPLLLLLCCTCREKLVTQTTKLVGPILPSGTMGINSTVGSYDGDILHARQMHYIHLLSRGSFIVQEPLFLVCARFHDDNPSPHQPGQLPKFCSSAPYAPPEGPSEPPWFLGALLGP